MAQILIVDGGADGINDQSAGVPVEDVHRSSAAFVTWFADGDVGEAITLTSPTTPELQAAFTVLASDEDASELAPIAMVTATLSKAAAASASCDLGRVDIPLPKIDLVRCIGVRSW